MDKTVRIGIVYTSTTPELIETVNQEIRKNLGDAPQLMNYQDPSILAEVRENGFVTAPAAATLLYGIIALILNAARVLDGPYFFLRIYETPISVVVMWFLIIAVLCLALSALYMRLESRQRSE